MNNQPYSSHQIKGLTTATGIWSSATIGIATGTGFYIAGILSTFLVIIILSLLKKFQKKLNKINNVSRVFVECENLKIFNTIRRNLLKSNIRILDLEIILENKECMDSVAFIVLVEDKRLNKTIPITNFIRQENGVFCIEML